MQKKRCYEILLFFLIAALLFSASGCSRRRIVDDSGMAQSTAAETAHNDSETEPQNTDKPSEMTETTDESEQTKSSTSTETKTPDGGSISDGGGQKVNTDNNSSDTVKAPGDSGDNGKQSDEGGAIGIIIDRYTKLLNDGLGSVCPGELVTVYMELETDYLTVNNLSEPHRLIAETSGQNVAEKLRNDPMTVGAEWIMRKNPAVIVKFVAPSTLGSGKKDTQTAASIYSRLIARNGFGGLGAVINNRVILLSGELMNTEHGRFIAKLYMARAMYPALFSDFDVDTVCKQVLGTDGVYYYGIG
ncbi:MAG: hypothetical protein LBQ48_06865 [Oscillospiraceae bacterium]|jgi:hypothetical protein|nr:hypothetical protein [Oscillospiraceae bacterium]